MTERPLPLKIRLLPLLVLLIAIAIWSVLSQLEVFPKSVFPSPMAAAAGLGEEFRSGRLIDDLVASLFRVTTGFALAVLLGVPIGLWWSSRPLAYCCLPASTSFAVCRPLPGYRSRFCGSASGICRQCSDFHWAVSSHYRRKLFRP